MENLIYIFGFIGFGRVTRIKNTKTGLTKDFVYSEDLTVLNGYAKELL